MYFFFCDDSKYDKPRRKGMGPLIDTGAIAFPADSIKNADNEINAICKEFGFPQGEEFKWSPNKGSWMRKNLNERRTEFFLQIIETAKKLGATASIIIKDKQYRGAIDKECHEIDAVKLLIERIELKLKRIDSDGVIIADRPSGGRKDEKRFLWKCLKTIQEGTAFVKPKHIALNVLTSSSHLIRLLQVADLVVSCTTEFVSGEDRYSPVVFKHILPLLNSERGRVGGIGLKIHPIYYVNLYYWICKDKKYYTSNGWEYLLPIEKSNYKYYDDDGNNS